MNPNNDHTNKSFVEALGIKEEEYKWIQAVVSNSFEKTEKVSEAIDHAIEELRHKEFGETTSHPSPYEYKIALSGVIVGMIINRMQSAHGIPLSGLDLIRFFTFLEEMSKHQGQRKNM